MGRRKKKAVSFPPSFARIFSRRETCLDTRQVFPRTVLGDFGHLLYFFLFNKVFIKVVQQLNIILFPAFNADEGASLFLLV